LTFNARTTSPHIQDYSGWSGEGLTDVKSEHVFYDKDPGLLANTMIEGQGGTGTPWDGKTVPSKNYGQPPRIIRLTFKITSEQAMGNKPITDADIVPNDAQTTIMLK